HNLQNVLASVAVAGILGADPEIVRDGLPQFRGVRRRMEVFHEAEGITFVDDFAHHPTAIHETIAAARMRWPNRRLIVLFEPRSNTTVTNRFRDDICAAFGQADEVWLGPIHRGDIIPPEERLDREWIARSLSAKGVAGHYADDVETILQGLRVTARDGDVVLILSNGAFGGIYARIRERSW
ncbi:MAG: cyanophycin synthetase, partial [FCB group bacterium]|nr:cyanophycin synthetase [FCB group bacterium]